MTADTGSVTSDGFRLRYIVEGAGPPALVVGSALYYSRAFSENLREHLRLVFMDHRGFAPSPGPRDTTAFALDTLIDDMEQVRQALDLGPVVVIGHSGHAFMALEYAKKYPSNVSHVVMIGIAPDLSAARTEATQAYWETSASAERKAVMEENLRRLPDDEIAQLQVSPGQKFIRTYIRNGPKAWYDPRFDSSPLWEGVEINMDMFNHVWGRIFRDIDITRGLETFDRPVFLALGRYDFLVAPPSSWEPLRPLFKDLTVRIFERSGHTPQYEEAAAFDEELVRWINR
ncbi:MAG: alpha/beta fold hydrolase [Gemmatimonadales bacterium]|nr:alpha/beta fold hydrolase [Gemmatimonadales bacterium]